MFVVDLCDSKFQDKLSEDGSRVKNVAHEFAIFFSVIDENLSWYLDKNIQKYTTEPNNVKKEDEDFMESNKMNGINGRIYGNLAGLKMAQKQTINWYLLSLGTEVDMHNVHFHGQTVLAVSATFVFFMTAELQPSVQTSQLFTKLDAVASNGVNLFSFL